MVRRQVSAYRALASESRVSILHLLQARTTPATVEELAEALGLHVNTVREHLDRLVATGFVAREPEVRTTRGRPRLLYRSVERAAAATLDDRARDHLARLLLEGYGRPVDNPQEVAEAAGRAWADAWHTGLPTVKRVPGDIPHDDVPHDPASRRLARQDEARWEQLAALETHFEDLGFDPEVDVDALEVRLRRCPFLDLARQRTDVVCSVHLGLSQGVLSRVEGPLSAEQLVPFVEPRLCVLHLRERLEGAPRGSVVEATGEPAQDDAPHAEDPASVGELR